MKKIHEITFEGPFFKCDFCSFHVSDRNHVDAKHNSVENKYACEECNTEYKTLNSMRAHRSRVHMKKKRLLEESDKARTTSFSPFVKLSKREHVQGNIQREILDLELRTCPGKHSKGNS